MASSQGGVNERGRDINNMQGVRTGKGTNPQNTVSGTNP